MARTDPQLKLRVTDEMKDYLVEAARKNNRSVNAEIVQRLEQSIEENELLKLNLPIDSVIELSSEAIANGMDVEEYVTHIIQDHLGKAESIDARSKMQIRDSTFAHLYEKNKLLEDMLNADFILYYTKVIQLSQFIDFILNFPDTLPEQIIENASNLQKLASKEIETLERRQTLIRIMEKFDQSFDETTIES